MISSGLFLEGRIWKQRGTKEKDFLNKFTLRGQGTLLVKIPKIYQSAKRFKRETSVHFALIWNKMCLSTRLWEPTNERNERKKRLEVKQANSSKSHVSETVIEIRLSFSCDVYVDVNRRKQRGEECLWLKKTLWINLARLNQKDENLNLYCHRFLRVISYFFILLHKTEL